MQRTLFSLVSSYLVTTKKQKTPLGFFVFFVCLTVGSVVAQPVSAYYYSEDFDSYVVNQPLDSVRWSGGVSSWLATNAQSFSAPISINYTSFTQVPVYHSFSSSTKGLISQWVRFSNIANFNASYLELKKGNGLDTNIGMRAIDLGSASTHRFQCGTGSGGENTVDISSFAWLNLTWYEMLLEYRQGSSSLQYRCGYRQQGQQPVYSSWRTPVNAVNAFTGAKINNSITAGNVNHDNFLIQTDVDSNGVVQDTTVTAGFTENYKTRFLGLTTGSDLLNVQYYLDQNEVNVLLPHRNPQQIRISYSPENTTNISSFANTISSGIHGTSTKVIDVSSISNGTYDIMIDFFHNGVIFGQPEPFNDSYIVGTMIVNGTTITITDLDFFNGLSIQADNRVESCGFFNLSGCIVNAFRYLFIPSQDSYQQFYTLDDDLFNRAPFIYVQQFRNSFNSIYGSPSTLPTISVAFASYGNITLLSHGLVSSVPFASLLRSLIGSLLWFMLGYAIYRKVLTMFDDKTIV